jgi:hypothetical protein
VGSLVDFVRLVGFSGIFGDPRRSVWRDDTVTSEHVVVERRACFIDSVREPAGKTVTAIFVLLRLQD